MAVELFSLFKNQLKYSYYQYDTRFSCDLDYLLMDIFEQHLKSQSNLKNTYKYIEVTTANIRH